MHYGLAWCQTDDPFRFFLHVQALPSTISAPYLFTGLVTETKTTTCNEIYRLLRIHVFYIYLRIDVSYICVGLVTLSLLAKTNANSSSKYRAQKCGYSLEAAIYMQSIAQAMTPLMLTCTRHCSPAPDVPPLQMQLASLSHTYQQNCRYYSHRPPTVSAAWC